MVRDSVKTQETQLGESTSPVPFPGHEKSQHKRKLGALTSRVDTSAPWHCKNVNSLIFN